MNIDISNAHCGPRIQFPDHAWLRVVYVPKDCLRQFCSYENDERRETCRVVSRSRGREWCAWCVGGGRESFSGRARRCLDRPRRRRHRRAPFSLDARARARAFYQIKERLRRTSDNWTFAKEREILRRSPLRVVRNEAEPFCVLSRRRDVILARAYRDSSNDRTCVSARPLWRCGVCYESLARACTLSLREREKGSCENLSRAMRFGSRGRPRVRVHEAYLACVFFLTHIGDRHDASCTPFCVVDKSAVGVCVIVPTALCDNRRSITAKRGCVRGCVQETTTRRVPAFYFERLKTQNG